ncbi:MAG: SRPBCC family protein [Anaerolineae bacterium]|nr:SRPBCC family protein [Anaerolineae bacterium]
MSAQNEPIVIAGLNITTLTLAPLRLVKSVWLRASQDKVFSVVADHQQLTELLPWVDSVTIDSSAAEVEGGIGTKRTCNFGNGLVLEEEIVGWNPPRMYAYQGVEATHPFGMKGHVAVVICEAQADHTMTLTWQHYFDHANPAAMQERMDDGMTCVMQRLIKRFGGKLLESYLNFK